LVYLWIKVGFEYYFWVVMRIFFFLTIFITSFFSSVGQQTAFDVIDSLAEKISVKHSKLEAEYLGFVKEKISSLEYSSVSDDAKDYITSKLIKHLHHLDEIYNFEIHEVHEKNALNWTSEFSEISLKDSNSIRSSLEQFMPEAYYAAEIFFKEYLTPDFRRRMANLYPGEIMFQLQFINTASAENIIEAEVVAKKLPTEAKKFFHYTNNLNTLLKTSKDDTIKVIYDIFKKYRFSGSSYPFLNEISKGRMTIDQAENICQDNVLSLNKLVLMLYDSNLVGVNDINNRIAILSTPFLKSLRYQKYLPIEKMDMGRLNELNNHVLWNLLIENYTILELRDLTSYIRLISPYFSEEKLTYQDVVVYSPEKYLGLLEKIDMDENLVSLVTNLFNKTSDNVLVEITETKSDVKLWANWVEEKIESKKSGIIVFNKKSIPEPKEKEIIEKFIFKDYNFTLSPSEKQKIKNKRDYIVYREKFDSLFSSPQEKELMFLLAETEPHLVLKNFDKIYKKEYSKALLERIAKQAPLTVKNYITAPDNLVKILLKESKDDTIKILFAVHDSLGNFTRASLFLEDISKNELSFEDADKYVKNKTLLINKLSDIVIAPSSVLGRFSAEQELSYLALDYVRSLIVSENNAINYHNGLENMDAKTLYLFMVLSEKEIIKGVFNKMLLVLHKKLNYDAFIHFIEKDMNGYGLTTFYRMLAFYNLGSTSSDFTTNRQKTLNLLFSTLDKESLNNINSFVNMGEIIIHSNQASLFSELEKNIRARYDAAVKKENNAHEVAIYGMLGSLLGNKLKMGWSRQAASHYNVAYTQGLSGYELFDKDLVSVHQYFFYNDDDGKASYRNFIHQYSQSAFNWNITDKGDFVLIESIKGRRVIILANKPENDESGIKSVIQYLKRENLNPLVVVHRGLSTHVLKTFNRIPSSAKIILDGSCGGFHVQHVALFNAPSAQILCNRNVGTMHLNDPLFKQISEEIRLGNDIVWESFWDKMEIKLGSNKYFSDYIPPHKNVSSVILKKYYELLKIDID
jgi:hypothetical protein